MTNLWPGVGLVVGLTMALGGPPSADPAPDPHPADPGAIAWTSCEPADPASKCGLLTVPVDWARPDRDATVRLRVAMHRASDPAHRVGVLMFNPGGPGAGAADIVARSDWASFYFPQQLLDRFDIVGIDPRGVAGSDALSCRQPAHDPELTRFPTNPADAGRLAAANNAFATSCVDRELAAHLDTVSVARDFDAARAALGEDRISFLGISYGTMLAQAYAENFPTRVRALVLDGVVDRALPASQLLLDGAAAVQDGLDRFADRCRATPACALYDRDVPGVLRQLDARAGRHDVRAGDRELTAEELHLAVNDALNSPLTDAQLAEGLRAAVDNGDGTLLTSLARYSEPIYAPYRAIICADVPRPPATALIGLARSAAAAGPSLGGTSEFWDIVSGCVGWPRPAQWTPHAWRVPRSITPLILSGEHDVATPRPWAVAVHRQLPGSTLLRWQGDGHAALPMHNRCAADAAIAYLTDLARPADADCAATPLPGTW